MVVCLIKRLQKGHLRWLLAHSQAILLFMRNQCALGSLGVFFRFEQVGAVLDRSPCHDSRGVE